MNTIERKKLEISRLIMSELEKREMTIFDLADELEIKSNLVKKVTGMGDYKIDTLILILEYLELKVEI